MLKRLLLIVTLLTAFQLCSFAQQKPASGLANPPGKSVLFYPNPAYVVINFELGPKTDQVRSLLIFNFMGKKVYETKSASPKITVNLENFYRGIYIFQVRDINGNILESGKFQVVK